MTTEIRARVDRLMLRYGLNAHTWSLQLHQELLVFVHDAVMTEQCLCIEILQEAGQKEARAEELHLVAG